MPCPGPSTNVNLYFIPPPGEMWALQLLLPPGHALLRGGHQGTQQVQALIGCSLPRTPSCPSPLVRVLFAFSFRLASLTNEHFGLVGGSWVQATETDSGYLSRKRLDWKVTVAHRIMFLAGKPSLDGNQEAGPGQDATPDSLAGKLSAPLPSDLVTGPSTALLSS